VIASDDAAEIEDQAAITHGRSLRVLMSAGEAPRSVRATSPTLISALYTLCGEQPLEEGAVSAQTLS
jgi:hypothetical protein